MTIWRGWVIEESLEDKSVLSKVKIVKSVTERNEQGEKVMVWRLDTVEVEDKDIQNIVSELAQSVKQGWYTHFTDFSNLIIVFKGKSFRIRLAEKPKEEQFGVVKFKADPKDLNVWEKALDYGTSIAKVDPRYIVEVK